MKVTIKHIDSDIPKENYPFFSDFIKYLQKNYPLKKDITIIFSESKVYVDGEMISESICRLKSGVYLYLSLYGQSGSYKLRAYYSHEQRNELDFLINSIKRQIKNGTNNIRTDKTEDK